MTRLLPTFRAAETISAPVLKVIALTVFLLLLPGYVHNATPCNNAAGNYPEMIIDCLSVTHATDSPQITPNDTQAVNENSRVQPPQTPENNTPLIPVPLPETGSDTCPHDLPDDECHLHACVPATLRLTIIFLFMVLFLGAYLPL